MSGRLLLVAAPVGYPWTFNGPRDSRHSIARKYFIPFNKINYRIEGVTAFEPFSVANCDLIHAFNRIPLNKKRFVVGFESHLPRAFGIEQSAYFRKLRGMLVKDRCRAIVAISEFAKNIFCKQHDNSPEWPELRAKLHVRFPNLPIPKEHDCWEQNSQKKKLKILFIGAHFARKGGCVGLRMAEQAHHYGIDLELTIVSSLEMGRKIWTDPSRERYFDHWRTLLGLPNVIVHPALPNSQVLKLTRTADFVLLTTFSDTFGFSILEAMANHCPVIATSQGAIPEIISDGKNGILIDLETTPQGDWIHGKSEKRSLPEFEGIIDAEIDRIAHEALRRIAELMSQPNAYQAMRLRARRSVEQLSDSSAATRFWDNLYDDAVSDGTPRGGFA